MLRLILFCAVLTVTCIFPACNSSTVVQQPNSDSAADKFQVGQVWKYHNRPGEDSSTITILKIERTHKGDSVIHIRVDGIKLFNPNVEGSYQHYVEHLPYAPEGLNKSVTALIGQNDNLPDFSEGYNNWKRSYDKGKAGVWTIEVSDAINTLDSIMHQQDSGSIEISHQ